LVTRLLGPGGYGRLAAIFAASQLVGQVLVHWTAVSLFRYGCEEFLRTGRVASAFWSRLLVVGLCLLVAIGVSPLWLPLLGGMLRISPGSYPLVLTHLIVTALWIHVQHTLQAAKLPRMQGFLLAMERAQITIILVALAVSHTGSLLSVTLSYIIAPLTALMIGLWRLRGLLGPVIPWNPALLKRMLAFSSPLIPASIFGYFASHYLDAFFITHFLTVSDLGLYSLVYQVAGTAMQLPLLAGSLVLPLFITLGPERQDRHSARFLRNVLPLLTLVWSTGCALAAPVGTWLLPMIFGGPFREAAQLLWPMMAMSALAGPVLMGYFPLSSALSTTRVIAANAALSAGINVVLNALLIPTFGLMGCAWATVVAYIASMAMTAHLVERRFLPNSTWVPQATLPAVIGALGALWNPPALLSITLPILVSALLTYRHRASVLDGLCALRATGAFDWALHPRLGSIARRASRR
jgi:O-antigen/teichoic acid export membrane protein